MSDSKTPLQGTDNFGTILRDAWYAKMCAANPVEGWQLCPKCKGEGVVFAKHATTTQPTEACPVCFGKMIINRQTGKPPEQ